MIQCFDCTVLRQDCNLDSRKVRTASQSNQLATHSSSQLALKLGEPHQSGLRYGLIKYDVGGEFLSFEVLGCANDAVQCLRIAKGRNHTVVDIHHCIFSLFDGVYPE